MPFSGDLFDQTQVFKHLGDGEHDQKDHGRKKGNSSSSSSDKTFSEKKDDLNQLIRDETPLQGIGEATVLAGLAVAAGYVGFKGGTHKQVQWNLKSDKFHLAHSADALKANAVKGKGTLFEMVGDNLNGMGEYSQKMHSGNKFWKTQKASLGDSTGMTFSLDDMQMATLKWSSGGHSKYKKGMVDPQNMPKGGLELMHAASNSAVPPKVKELHRGMRIDPKGELRLHSGKTIKVDDLKPGQEIDMLPDSFSTKKSVASTFATGMYGMGAKKGGVKTIVTVKQTPNRTGLNIDPVTTAAYKFEDEWIMGGTFKVTEVKKNTFFGTIKADRHIIVEQVAPPDFDYAKAKKAQAAFDNAMDEVQSVLDETNYDWVLDPEVVLAASKSPAFKDVPLKELVLQMGKGHDQIEGAIKQQNLVGVVGVNEVMAAVGKNPKTPVADLINELGAKNKAKPSGSGGVPGAWANGSPASLFGTGGQTPGQYLKELGIEIDFS